MFFSPIRIRPPPPAHKWVCISISTTMDKNDEKDENSCQEHNRCFIGCKTLQMSNLRCHLVQTGPSSLCSESTVSICHLLRHFEPSCFYCFFLDAGCRQFGCVAGQVDGRCAPGVT